MGHLILDAGSRPSIMDVLYWIPKRSLPLNLGCSTVVRLLELDIIPMAWGGCQPYWHYLVRDNLSWYITPDMEKMSVSKLVIGWLSTNRHSDWFKQKLWWSQIPLTFLLQPSSTSCFAIIRDGYWIFGIENVAQKPCKATMYLQNNP